MSDISLVEEIFLTALEQGTPEECAAYLDEACKGDADLRRRVERLLDAHPQAMRFLAKTLPPLSDKTAVFDDLGEAAGTLIVGRFKLLEEIGEGGMGTVWLAEQIEPVRRKVALKLIKAGMDSKSVLARFEAERQALALMDHPNIAKVLDGGVTQESRPFFVMEYVKGVPLTQYCDDGRLTVEERLKLFVPICHAIQHAHQKGIVHRDLKPTNVLVYLSDGMPVPKVIDFGLAKAMHHPLTEHTLLTDHGAILGTPIYMSPEQADLSNLDVDTRTDIYSLGVMLYELLTGTTPLERQRFKEAAWQEAIRVIKEENPPPPSSRLSSTANLPNIAAQRQTEPVKLSRLLKGELDWIVMKALEKERGRRYLTPVSFAEDIERFLRCDVVIARPPSTGYRLRKFIHRHRTAVLTTVAFAVLLLAATIISTWLAITASRAEKLAWALKNESDEIRDAEIVARRKAEVEAFVAKYNERRHSYESLANEVGDSKSKEAQNAFLRISQLLRHLPAHAPAWRDHLVMYVIGTARKFASVAVPPERPQISFDGKSLNGNGTLIWTSTSDRSYQIRDFPALTVRTALAESTLDRKDRRVGLGGFLPSGHYRVDGSASRIARDSHARDEDRYVWTGGSNGDPLRFWDSNTGQSIGQTPHAKSKEYPLLSLRDILITRNDQTNAAGGTVYRVLNVPSGQPLAVLEDIPTEFEEMVLSPDGNLLVASDRNELLVWSTRTGKLHRRIEGFEHPVKAIAFNRSGQMFAACTRQELHWFTLPDWTMTKTRLKPEWMIGTDEAEEKVELDWAEGSDQLVRIHGVWGSLGSGGSFDQGARVDSEAILPFVPLAVKGSFVLAHDGSVFDADSCIRIVPAIGHRYPEEARRFAIDGRWLPTSDRLVDLAVESALFELKDLVPIGRDQIGWAWDANRYDDGDWDAGLGWTVPERPDRLDPEMVALWVESLFGREIVSESEYRDLTDDEWNACRRRWSALSSKSSYHLPDPLRIGVSR
jgi:serine/threonine protein kinase